MKITPSKAFVEWFERTNPHLFEGEKLDAKRFLKEVNDYINDVLLEDMESLDSELDLLNEGDEDDSPDSGFLDGSGEQL